MALRSFTGSFLVISLFCVLQCNSLFYYPDKKIYSTPGKWNLEYEDVYFKTADEKKLHAWLLKSKTAVQGTLIHFHGNAQNISSHFLSSAWLTQSGYNVFIFDYRGYGKSESKKPSPEGVLLDAKAAIEYVLALPPETRGEKTYLYGQSLGGIIALKAFLEYSQKKDLSGLIIESSFSSYQDIASDRLSSNWLTWSFQWLPFLLVSDATSPEPGLKAISPTPVMVVHGTEDRVVPFEFGKRIFEQLESPRYFFAVKGARHIQCFQSQEARDRLLLFLQRGSFD